MADFNIFDPSTWNPQPLNTTTGPNAVINGVEDTGLPMPKAPAVINGKVDPGLAVPYPGQKVTQNPVPAKPMSEADILKASMAQLDAGLANPDAMAAIALSQDRGNTLTKDNVLLNDYRGLTPVEFIQKYGQNAYEKVSAVALEGHNIRREAITNRTIPDMAGDAAVQIAQGFNQSAIGIADMVIRTATTQGPVQDFLLAQTAGLSSDMTARTRRLESGDLQTLRHVDAIRTQLDQIDNAAASQADKADDTNFVDSLVSFGRDVLREGYTGGKRLIEDPNMLGATSAEGIGSLLTAGPITKATNIGVKALNELVAPGLKGLAARTVESTIEKSTFPLIVGAMEGGSNAIQAEQDVLSMPQAELDKSAKYQELISQGLTPEGARQRLAATAGTIAAVPSAVVGAATGKLVEGIEMKPFTSALTKPLSVPVNAAKESIEEGIQSGVGQFSSNLGVQASGADPTQNLSAGVGEQAVQGAAAGAGTTVLTQGPGATLELAFKGLGSAVMLPIKALAKRGEKNMAQTAAESPVSAENMRPAAQAAAASAPSVAADLQAMAAAQGAKSPEVDTYVNKVQDASQLQQTDVAIMPPQVREVISQIAKDTGVAPNKFDALAVAAAFAKDETASQQDRVVAATYVLKNIESNRQLFEEDVPKFLNNVPQDSPEFKAFHTYASILTAIRQTPAIKQALDWAQADMRMPEQDLSAVDLNSPEGAQIVNTAVDVASLVPTAVSVNVADQILNQDSAGKVTLTPDQRRILQGAKALQTAANTYASAEAGKAENELPASPPKNALEFVNKQIEEAGGSKGHQRSLVQHVQDIAKAVSSGKPELVRQRVKKLNAFAKSHRNKVAAANRSIQNGDGKNVPYTAADPEGVGYQNTKGWGVIVGNEGSERAARTVHAEAVAIASLSNSYAAQYPEFNLQQVEVPDLALDAKKGSSATVTEAPAPSQATTAKTEATSVQPEPPLQPSEPTRASEAKSPAVETVVEDTTNRQQNDTQPAVADAPPAETVKQVSEPTSSAPAPKESTGNPVTQETVQPAVDTPPEPVSETTDPLANLVQPKGRNFFRMAFKFPKKATSRLVGEATPLNKFLEALSDGRAFRAFMNLESLDGIKLTVRDTANLRQLLAVGNDVLAVLDDRLSKVINQEKVNKQGEKKASILARLEAGVELHRVNDLLPLNIVDNTNGDYLYNQNLIETAILAGLDWVLNATNRVAPVTDADIAGILGIEEDQVTDQQRTDFENGMSTDIAARTLADNIRKFWGVEANNAELPNYVEGIPEGIAKELLHAFESVGLLTNSTLKYPGLTDKTPGRVRFDQRSQEVNDLVRSVDGVSNTFADMALIDREIEGYAFKPIEDVDKTQLRNRIMTLSQQNREALENTQAAPYYPNPLVFDFIEAMGLESFVSLMSGRPYTKGDLDKKHTDVGLNKRHWGSIQGLQRSLVASFTNVSKQMAQVKKQGGAPVYYRHHINKLGRVQMAGLSNPQVDKLAREIFMTTLSKIDLTKPANLEKFLVGIGQGIGLKTEKLTREDVIKQVIADTMTDGGKLKPLVYALFQWQVAVTNGDSRGIPAETMKLLSDENGKPILSLHGLHSVLALAKYQLAQETGQDLTQFETLTYLEADGKTNGPINALMLMATGKIRAEWLKAIGKGGVYFGRLGKTYNAFFNSGEDGANEDLYQAGALGAQKNIAALGEELKADSEDAYQLFKSFQRLIATLNVDVALQGGDLVLKRGITKNPLTITIYGSGAAGIAGKVTDELMSEFYERLSTGNVDADLVGSLSLLTSRYVNQKDGKWFASGKATSIGEIDTLTFELSPAEHKQLKSNIEKLFVNPMRTAIEANVTAHVSPVTKALQEATQIQSIFLKALTIDRITTRIALKKSNPEKYNYNPGDFLSENEQQDIRQSLMKFAPVINTGTQGYFLSGGDSADLFEKTTITIEGQQIDVTMPEAFSRSLTSDMSTPAFYYGATLAGVKAIPTTVVGSGDGQMVMNYLSENPGAAKRSLHVFDGINMPADAIDEYSRLANEAVFKSWTSNGNVVRAAFESFTTFMEQNPIEVLFGTGPLNKQQEEAKNDLAKTILGPELVKTGETVTLEAAQAFMDNLLERMGNIADETDARRMTYAQMPMSIDQMASAESPYINYGDQELRGGPELDYDQLVDVMNGLYELNLAEIQGRSVQGPITAAVDTVGTADEAGVRVVHGDELPALFKELSSQLTLTQKEMMRQATKLLDGSGYRVVFGTSAQLDAWEQANNADRYTPNTERAKIDPVAKVILISSTEAETVVHELIHAATIDKVRAFYKDPSSLSQVERDAVARIEGLMGEWLDQDPGNGDAYEARRLAEAAIDGHLSKGRKAEALNEFMAWVLSNQHLAEVAKKTKAKNPLFQIPANVLAAIKTLLWGGAKLGPRVGESLFSNLRFNTRVLMAGPTSIDRLQQDSAAVSMYQSRSFGSNDRLSEIRSRLHNRIVSWIKGDDTPLAKATRAIRGDEINDARKLADQVTGLFAYHFADLGTMQAKSTFSMIQLALMTEIELNSGALSRAEDLYAHVVKQLDYTKFMVEPDIIPTDPNDEKQAREKLDAILGKFLTVNDKHGRSSLMSSFLALATTSDEFRKILAGLEKPKADKSNAKGLDGVLENAAMSGLDRLNTALLGEDGTDANVRDAIDNLMYVMIEEVGDQRSFIEQRTENGLDKIEGYLSKQIQDKSALIAEKSADISRNSKSRVVKAVASTASVIATAINEQKSSDAAKGLVHWFNNHEGWDSVKAVVADFIGRTSDNAPIYDMISKVRATVQQVRQQFREDLPVKLNKMFKKPVSDKQWTAMFKALGKTDIAALASSYGLSGAHEMLTNGTRRAAEIFSLEAGLDKSTLAKAKQLAHFMVTGEHGVKLLRNAYAIAALANPGAHNLKADQVLVDKIDQLVSLYAIEDTSPADRGAVADLLDTEKEGVEFVTSYLMGQRVDEVAKANATSAAKLNHYKGYIPSEAKQGGSLIIASDTEHSKLLARGYVRVSAYNGSVADRSLGKRSYYFAPVTGRAPFSQGVLQTVHQTASGVDPHTGYTVGEVMAGRIQDPVSVRLAEQLLNGAKPGQTSENLLPVYDSAGRVIAFERAADPVRLSKLDRSTDLAKMIGAWRGRQAEEMLSQQVNSELIGKLYADWKQGEKDGQQREFVNIAALDPKTDDPILIEAAKLIPEQTVKEIASVFGPNRLMVRRSMLLDTFGARQASVGDLFTGQTRWKPQVASNFEKIANGIFSGRKLLKEKSAYEILVGTEQTIQNVVGNIKTIIVVKSVIVPAANMVSNMFQLMNRGVPIRSIIHGMGAKTGEINTYVQRRAREVDLEAELRAAEAKNDTGTALKLGNQIQALRDSYKRMSIWPLIEAGEFSAISQGQPTVEDLAISNGGWLDWVEKKVAGLKEPLRTPARYALVTQDTALFQGLARAVQYGDFVAKAVLYDDLTSRKKLGKKEAIATVNEAFVNYNRLAGRGRQYLESVGLLWFYNFKLRSMKEAAYMLRHNPLRSLITMAVPALPVIGNIGSPITDNVVSIFNDGKLGYSIGPNMGLGVWRLNPWINLVH